MYRTPGALTRPLSLSSRLLSSALHRVHCQPPPPTVCTPLYHILGPTTTTTTTTMTMGVRKTHTRARLCTYISGPFSPVRIFAQTNANPRRYSTLSGGAARLSCETRAHNRPYLNNNNYHARSVQSTFTDGSLKQLLGSDSTCF